METDIVTKPLTITDLGYGQCRFPTTGFEAKVHLFCGEPVEHEKCPYCATHAAIAFDRRSVEVKRQRALMMAMARIRQNPSQRTPASAVTVAPKVRMFEEEQFGRDS